MIEAVLWCALALPVDRKDDYHALKKFIEKRELNYTVVFINENEKLLNKKAFNTRTSVVVPGKESLMIWLLKRAT